MSESSRTEPQAERVAVVTESATELAFSLDSVRIEPLSRVHERGAFVCSPATIQNFCRNNARKQNESYAVRVFVACIEGSQEVIGYYHLSLSSYKIRESVEESVQKPLHLDAASDAKFERVGTVPAVYLGMIGVHSEYQNKGIGKLLMMDAIQRTAKIAEHAGLYALTLDALDEGIASYYRDHFDFQNFKEGEKGLEMFLPIKTIFRAIS